MDEYRNRYATVKARGLNEIEYTLTMHYFAVRWGGIEKKEKDSEAKAESKMLKIKDGISYMECKNTNLRERLGLEELPPDLWSSVSSLPETLPEDEEENTRFYSSICRSRSAVVQYAANNPWDYFVTLTFDPKRENLNMDLKDLEQVKKKVLQFFVNYSRRSGAQSEFKYLLVPEFQENGNVHFHGFMKGINEKDLFKNENGYLDFKPYRDKFGFCSMQKIKDQNKAAVYATKYINKDMFQGKEQISRPEKMHLYYASKGLKKDKLVCVGTYKLDIEDFLKAGYDCYDFGYCGKVTTDDLDVLLDAVEPYSGFVEGINDNDLSRKTVFNAFMRKAHEYDIEDYNDRITNFMKCGFIDFGKAVELWRDDMFNPPLPARLPEEMPKLKFEPMVEHIQQKL